MANIKCRYYTYWCNRYDVDGRLNGVSNEFCFTGDEEWSSGYCNAYLRCSGTNCKCEFLREQYHEFEKNVKSYELDAEDANEYSRLRFRGACICVNDIEYLEIDGRILIGADNEKEESE